MFIFNLNEVPLKLTGQVFYSFPKFRYIPEIEREGGGAFGRPCMSVIYNGAIHLGHLAIHPLSPLYKAIPNKYNCFF